MFNDLCNYAVLINTSFFSIYKKSVIDDPVPDFKQLYHSFPGLYVFSVSRDKPEKL